MNESHNQPSKKQKHRERLKRAKNKPHYKKN
jgi:hypothetical protein